MSSYINIVFLKNVLKWLAKTISRDSPHFSHPHRRKSWDYSCRGGNNSTDPSVERDYRGWWFQEENLLFDLKKVDKYKEVFGVPLYLPNTPENYHLGDSLYFFITYISGIFLYVVTLKSRLLFSVKPILEKSNKLTVQYASWISVKEQSEYLSSISVIKYLRSRNS